LWLFRTRGKKGKEKDPVKGREKERRTDKGIRTDIPLPSFVTLSYTSADRGMEKGKVRRGKRRGNWIFSEVFPLGNRPRNRVPLGKMGGGRGEGEQKKKGEATAPAETLARILLFG